MSSATASFYHTKKKKFPIDRKTSTMKVSTEIDFSTNLFDKKIPDALEEFSI